MTRKKKLTEVSWNAVINNKSYGSTISIPPEFSLKDVLEAIRQQMKFTLEKVLEGENSLDKRVKEAEKAFDEHAPEALTKTTT